MSAPTPSSRPQASLAVVMAAAEKAFARPLPDIFVLAVRSYYRDTMGEAGTNDYGMYDDALFVVSPLGFSGWNGNTDPSRLGWNPNAGKCMARLKIGNYKFRRLKHRARRPDGYMAFGQGPNRVVVERLRKDGTIALTESGEFGINLHRGGNSGTSSEGCLTVPTGQWPQFDKMLSGVLETTGMKDFDLILIEGPLV